MPKLTIPYESLDPLTIGAADDESKVSRESLELDIPDANLLAAIYPDEPEPLDNATEAARAALEAPVSGPRFSELLASATRVAIVIDNQFRPTPTSIRPSSGSIPPSSASSRRTRAASGRRSRVPSSRC